MTLRLNGRDVAGGGTLLDVCRRERVAVPALCHDDRVEPGGHCRACMVEVDGRLAPACTTAATDGAVVDSDSARVRDYRRDLGELMAAESEPRARVAALVQEWGVQGSRYRRDALHATPLRDTQHPFLRLDMSACILCRLCARVCAEVQGQFVYAVEGRGAGARLSWGPGAFSDTACVACGACVSACPTGAISDVDRSSVERAAMPASTRQRGARQTIDRVVRTTCAYCGVGCQLDVAVAGDDIAFIEGAASAVNHRHLCVKGRYLHSFARHPERLTSPLLRRGKRLVAVSWQEAIAYVASELARYRDRTAVLASSRCTNEENYLLQKWARAGLHTNNVDCCARVCHAPSAAGMRRSFGAGAATNSLADIEASDLLFVCGSNTTESHPVVGARVKQAVLAGARLVVVDPRRTELAALADVHLAPRLGTNVPLLNSLAAVIVEEGLCDDSFVAERTRGFDEFARFVSDYRPEAVESVTGVPAREVRTAARMYAGARSPMQLHGLGVTEHVQGAEAVMLLCNLALLCGAVGRDGVGVNPLRGQNNVQGAADMGCQPDLMTGYAPVADAAARSRFEALWHRPVPSSPGLTLPRMYEAIDCGDIRAMFLLGENVVQTDPDAQRVRARLANLELLVVQEIFLTETARMAHVVLPGASAFEKDGTFTNAERRVQRVRRVLAPPGQARADSEILCDLMRAAGLAADYAGAREIFDEIRALAPMLAGADYDAVEAQGLQWPVTPAHPRGTATLHRDGFGSGAKAPLHCVAFTPSPALAGDARRPLRLTTGRVLEHYNSGSMTRRSEALRLACADFLEIHPDDARVRGVVDGDAVMVASEFGEAAAVAAVTDTVPPGTLFLSFHFPETGTNSVTSDVVDRLSDCPEYKVTAVEVRRAE
ncbi:MAG: formate dehydrogenase subunit alpha [Deltaproteobacteria bacterium]|nr:formate dehydrogenase subunit alpha [Deltaproteobacteria bacterium]